MTCRLWRLLTVAMITLGPVAVTASAEAHGDDETQEAYVLVQQALAHLAHGTGHEGMDLAMEKVHDALEADDQEGVDVSEVEQGMEALEADRVEEARTLLEDAIAEALVGRPLAVGYETGTGLVPPALPGRDPLDGGDWLVLALCVAVVGVGAWLSVRFRPHDSMSALRLLLGVKPGAREASRRTSRIRIARHPR